MSLTRMPSGVTLFNASSAPADTMLNDVLIGEWSAVVVQAKLNPDLLFQNANSGEYHDLSPLSCAVIMGHTSLLDDLYALAVMENFLERYMQAVNDAQSKVDSQKLLLTEFLEMSERYQAAVAATRANNAELDVLFQSWKESFENIQVIPASYRESLLSQVKMKREKESPSLGFKKTI